MINVLRVDSSAFGSDGASTRLNSQLVEHLTSRYGEIRVATRDLVSQALPHVTSGFMQALGKSPTERSKQEADQVALADRLIAELREADIVVIGAPMYNFTVPSTLKTWMDHVARAGDTFKYTASGAVGLLGNKQVYINTSRGGVHKGQSTDGVVPLLKNFFSLLGLNNVTVIYAEGLNMGAETRGQALAQAERTINTLAVWSAVDAMV